MKQNMQQEIKHTWHFNRSSQEVWEYLTKSELIEQWLGKTDFKQIVGHKFHIIGKLDSRIYCEVLEIAPYTHLSYSWQTNSVKDNKPFNSKVTWILVPKENGTELQLLHNSFIFLEDYMVHNNGWTTLGNRLLERLNTGKNDGTNI